MGAHAISDESEIESRRMYDPVISWTQNLWKDLDFNIYRRAFIRAMDKVKKLIEIKEERSTNYDSI